MLGGALTRLTNEEVLSSLVDSAPARGEREVACNRQSNRSEQVGCREMEDAETEERNGSLKLAEKASSSKLREFRV